MAEWTHMLIVPPDWEVKLVSAAHVKEVIVMPRAAYDGMLRPTSFYSSFSTDLFGEPIYPKDPVD